jgi:hypothetical protein
VEIKAGTRLKSATDSTEVMVVKAPGTDVDLRCGGHPLLAMDAEGGGAAIESGFEEGTLVGKRYEDAAASLEILCTKGGPASLSLGADLLTPKGAKALPASD